MKAQSTRRCLVGRLSFAGAVLGTLLAAQSTAIAATSVFDGANRLVSTTEGATTVTYAYNGLGNIVRRCVNAVCTDLVLDESSSLAQVVGEVPAGGATPLTYAYGPAGLAAQRGTATHYPLTDSLGTVRGLADAAGALSGRRAMDAFGATRSLVGVVSNIGYTGEFTGAEDGKVWLRARSYDPKLGRFDQRDSFEGFAERGSSLNRYGYGEGNPVVNTDPSGHGVFAIPAIIIVGGMLGLLVTPVAMKLGDVLGSAGLNVGPCEEKQRSRELGNDVARVMNVTQDLLGAVPSGAGRRPRGPTPKSPNEAKAPSPPKAQPKGTPLENDILKSGDYEAPVMCGGTVCAWALGRSPIGLDGNPWVPTGGVSQGALVARIERAGRKVGKGTDYSSVWEALDAIRSASKGSEFLVIRKGHGIDADGNPNPGHVMGATSTGRDVGLVDTYRGSRTLRDQTTVLPLEPR
jgi:RHS repeat-associated protein